MTESSSNTRPNSLDVVKALAYANDTLILLHFPDNLSELQQTITLYEQSPNAKLNYSKAQVCFLSGQSSTWTHFMQQLPRPITS
jgi:hypothetical protein